MIEAIIFFMLDIASLRAREIGGDIANEAIVSEMACTRAFAQGCLDKLYSAEKKSATIEAINNNEDIIFAAAVNPAAISANIIETTPTNTPNATVIHDKTA